MNKKTNEKAINELQNKYEFVVNATSVRVCGN